MKFYLEVLIMPIASYKPGQRPETFNNIPQIYPKRYNGIVKDNKYVPQEALLQYVEGMRWTVDYYSQLLGDSLNTQMLDSVQPGLYQQYVEVKNLIIQVNTPLTSTQDTENNRMIVTGSAYVIPNIVPNQGDIFIASTGNGQLGLFQVTSSNRKTYMENSVFEIEYVYITVASPDSERVISLKSKVVQTNYFMKIENNDRPTIVASTEYENVINYEYQLRQLYQLYFKSFFNLSFNTLIIPGQEPNTIIDLFLLRAVQKISDTDDHPNVVRLNKPNFNGEPYLEQPTIWDAMLKQDISLLGVTNNQMAPADIFQFNGNPYLESAKYSFIDYVIYPVAPDESLFVENPEYPKGLSPFYLSQSQIALNGSQIDTISNTYTTVNTTIPIIYSTVMDDYYVFTTNFYNPNVAGNQMSVLEILVTQYLNRQAINTTMLNAVLANYLGWTRLDQFYFIPILIFLIRNVLKNY